MIHPVTAEVAPGEITSFLVAPPGLTGSALTGRERALAAAVASAWHRLESGAG